MNVRTISAYCLEFNESKCAVTKRIENGVWVEGQQWFKVKGSKERWIDLEGVERWVRNGGSSLAA
ncbi:hypothetical protein [Paraglaciecola sp.]|uniref:hypothetical protein n=1 Tax=Paraglaciecola sp. TaxID=1920173 RepID=UPI003EF0F550